MGVVGKPRSYDKRFLFTIEIDQLTVAWFESASAIEAEVGVVEQHEGGKINVANQAPGKVKWSPVTLSIGATDNDELYQWWLLVVDSAANAGQPDDSYKKGVAIVQRDRDGSERKRWNLREAWPSKAKFGEWDAKAEENVVEEYTLTFKYAEKQKKQ